jgi:peptidyl-prolyl cis-trans isomerase C
MKRFLFVLTVLIAVAVCGGCAKKSASKSAFEGVVVTVNGHEVTRAVLEAFTKSRTGHSYKDLGATEQARTLDDLIEMVLIADAPRPEDPVAKAAVDAEIELARIGLTASQKAKDFLATAPSEQEIKTEYDAQLQLMAGQSEYLTRHIVVDSQEKADAIVKQLNAGGDFIRLAAGHSQDPSAKEGIVAWIGSEQREKMFADAVRDLKKGQYTPAPVHSQFGWHVIRLEDTRARTPPDYETAKAQIKETLQRKRLRAYIDGLKKTAKTEKKI